MFVCVLCIVLIGSTDICIQCFEIYDISTMKQTRKKSNSNKPIRLNFFIIVCFPNNLISIISYRLSIVGYCIILLEGAPVLYTCFFVYRNNLSLSLTPNACGMVNKTSGQRGPSEQWF